MNLDDYVTFAASTQNLHADMAAIAFPNGGVLYCPTCHTRRTFTVQAAVNFYRWGWPTCCGRPMQTEFAEATGGR